MSRQARILIVDDSRIFRAAVAEALAGVEDMAVVGEVYNGEKAMEFIRTAPPDMVTLDLEMPGMGGLETLRAIQQVNAGRPPGSEIGVVVVSSFTRRGGEVTVRALQAGAFDFITKPSGENSAESGALLRQQLLLKIRLFLARRGKALAAVPVPPPGPNRRRWTEAAGGPVRAILIASSTGGPRALEQ